MSSTQFGHVAELGSVTKLGLFIVLNRTQTFCNSSVLGSPSPQSRTHPHLSKQPHTPPESQKHTPINIQPTNPRAIDLPNEINPSINGQTSMKTGSKISTLIPISINCKGSLEDLILQCAKYVEVPGPVVAPSQACCNWVQQADIPCLCRNISNELELILSPEKVAYVAKYCQRPLQSGTKRGSKKAVSDSPISLHD
ncbi:endosperm transfer cell specific PR60 precursor [Cinnamomum micranthum f. kanehirae]|uniref:Endosperm transfer cell specific PR60 n=1 Tax=Cinnamomum micranthum f. kanehirae TaxID=337451 RepID=A0A3S3QLC3_9MAGN|nr:endosperm transfer cell specific PR60 precursor [Cinnamomum micranthum f. kanehirae]